jgi:hypothetical protein
VLAAHAQRPRRLARERRSRRPLDVVADRPPAAAPRRAAVREYADDLIAVARRLRQPDPIDVTGAAMVARLVFDWTSPMYRDGTTSLRHALRSARLALDPVDTAISDVWAVG